MIDTLVKVVRGLVKLAGATDGTLIGNTGSRLNVQTEIPKDAVTGEVMTIDHLHAELHEGDAYSHIDCHDVGNGSTFYYLIQTPNTSTRIHFRTNSACILNGRVQLFEGGTTSFDGYSASKINRDRNSSNTPTLALYHAPTVTADGTLLEDTIFDSKSTDEDASDLKEFILKQNTKYILKFSSLSSSNTFNTRIHWYEES